MYKSIKLITGCLEECRRTLEIKIHELEKVFSNTTNLAEETVRNFHINSIVVFSENINYIRNSLNSLNSVDYVNLLPNTRTCFDIYFKFLFISNLTDHDEMLKVCNLQRLQYLRHIEDKQSFDELLSLFSNDHKVFFEAIDDYASFSFNKINRDKYLKKILFPSAKSASQTNIQYKSSKKIDNIFKGKQIAEIYSFISEISHGNPNYNYPKPHNEIFWIFTICTMCTLYITCIIDRDILNKGESKDQSNLIKHINKIKNEIVIEWNELKEAKYKELKPPNSPTT